MKKPLNLMLHIIENTPQITCGIKKKMKEGDGMFSIWTAEEKKPFPAPFSGLIAEVNGEVEINPDLANDSAYDLGWIIILEPHDLDLELLLDPDEYVEYLAEL